MLKSLELFGFKSFADKTIFEFSSGITGVVGPNGSGKSNVVDGIKWLLGDQSAKSLRGKDMTDVIFNGAVGRKASSFAEATLTFDNTTEFLPIESTEVSIGRRLWQSGDSEYLINGNTARLKDIRDLLAGTGIGTSSYCIIEQGRVDQILQSNPTNRRKVFEEAAGIARFKSRRVEAERKLERVQQNLLRLQDIVDEVESQLNTIRTQAAKAAKYKKFSDELRATWLGLVADDYRFMKAQTADAEVAVERLSGEIEELSNEQLEIESRITSLDAEINTLDDELREAEGNSSAHREEMASHESTIRHLSLRSRELELEIGRLRKQQASATVRANSAAKQREAEEQSLETVEREFEELNEQLAAAESRLANFDQELDAARDEIAARRDDFVTVTEVASAANSEITGCQHKRDALLSSQDSVNERAEQIEQRITAVEERQQAAQLELDAALADVTKAEEELQTLQHDRKSLLGEKDSSQKTLAQLREERSAALARKSLLEDLEYRQEGLGIGVREIMKRAETSKHSPWKDIIGSVADLLDVDLEQAPLVDIALGGRAQLLVIREFEPLVEYLYSGACNITGRVGFVSPDGRMISLNDSKPTDAETSSTDDEPKDLRNLPGVQQRADQLVRSPAVAPQLAATLLAQTWIVDTLDTAFQLAAGEGKGCRFVTLQGETLEPNGTIFVGSVRAEMAIVSRKSELRRLKADLGRLDKTIDDKQQNLAVLGQSLTEKDGAISARESNLQETLEKLNEHKASAAVHQKELDRLQQERVSLTEELGQIEPQIEAADRTLEELQKNAKDTEAEIEAARVRITEAEHALSALEQERYQIEQDRADRHLIQAKHEDRVTASRQTCARLADEQVQHEKHGEEAGHRLQDVTAKSSEATLQLLNARSALDANCWFKQAVDKEVAKLAERRRDLRSQRAKINERDLEVRQHRRALDDELHQSEILVRDAEHKLRAMGERIEEEYQLTLEEVVESGASAFRDYLDDEHPDWREQLAAERADQHHEPVADDDTATNDESGNADADEYKMNGSAIEATSESDEPDYEALQTVDEADPTEFEDDDSDDDALDDEELGEADEELQSDDEEELIDESDDEEAANEDADQDTDAEDISDEASDEQALFDLPLEELIQIEAPASFAEIRDGIEDRVNGLRRKIRNLGNVSTESLNNLEVLETRFSHLSEHLQDLVEAKQTLEDIVRRINTESKRMFAETFDSIRGFFQTLFRKLFGGGEGDIILEDPEDILECGIDVVARPPGKELRSISLLSGGERTMTAVALALAMFKSRPSPFCVLDEVDAALDDANVDRYVGVLKDFRDSTQFIMITHRKPSMAATDVLYGVTMEQSGVSKRMSVRFQDVSDNGEFKVPEGEDETPALKVA